MLLRRGEDGVVRATTGKHAGEAIGDVPVKYLAWVYWDRSWDLPKDVHAELAELLERSKCDLNSRQDSFKSLKG